MESLVAANSPESIDVDVLVLVNLPKQPAPHANALGRAAGRMAAGETASGDSYQVIRQRREKAPTTGCFCYWLTGPAGWPAPSTAPPETGCSARCIFRSRP